MSRLLVAFPCVRETFFTTAIELMIVRNLPTAKRVRCQIGQQRLGIIRDNLEGKVDVTFVTPCQSAVSECAIITCPLRLCPSCLRAKFRGRSTGWKLRKPQQVAASSFSCLSEGVTHRWKLFCSAGDTWLSFPEVPITL